MAQCHPSIRRERHVHSAQGLPLAFLTVLAHHVNHRNGDASDTRQEGPEKTVHSLAPGWAILQRENEL